MWDVRGPVELTGRCDAGEETEGPRMTFGAVITVTSGYGSHQHATALTRFGAEELQARRSGFGQGGARRNTRLVRG